MFVSQSHRAVRLLRVLRIRVSQFARYRVLSQAVITVWSFLLFYINDFSSSLENPLSHLANHSTLCRLFLNAPTDVTAATSLCGDPEKTSNMRFF